MGDNGAQFIDLLPGDIVFNHLQTKELLAKKNLVKMNGQVRGQVIDAFKHASGMSKATGTLPEGLLPYTPTASELKMQEAFRAMVHSDDFPNTPAIRSIVEQQTEQMKQSISNITKNSSSTTINVNGGQTFTITGVNNEQVLRQIQGAFEGLFLNAYQSAMKNS